MPRFVIAHFPNEVSTSELNSQIIKAVETLSENDFNGNLIIVEPGKIKNQKEIICINCTAYMRHGAHKYNGMAARD